MSARTLPHRLLALAGLAVGAVLALVAGSRAWWRAAGTGVSVAFPGTEATGGLAQALALVVLAGALLALVLRSRGRRVLGVLLALTGAGVLVLGAARPRPSSGTVQSRVLEVSLADQFALVGTAWPYVYAAAGVLVVGAAVLMTVTAPRWPTRPNRFERPGQGVAPAGARAGADREEDPASLWRSLDAGLDPTLVGGPDGEDDGTVQPPGTASTNRSAEPTETLDEQEAEPGSTPRGGVQADPGRVTMKPRVAARTDEPT